MWKAKQTVNITIGVLHRSFAFHFSATSSRANHLLRSSDNRMVVSRDFRSFRNDRVGHCPNKTFPGLIPNFDSLFGLGLGLGLGGISGCLLVNWAGI